jgi:uncharacterized membrane protein YfcA
LSAPDLTAHAIAAAAAFVISLVTSTAGVTGAFLLVPLQVSVLGIVSPSASATNHLYNVLAAPGGARAYARQGRLIRPLAAILIVGTLPGIFVGIVLRLRFLPEPGPFKLFAGSVLMALGVTVLLRAAARRAVRDAADADAEVRDVRLSWRRLEYAFGSTVYRVDPRALAVFSWLVGAVGGCYGVGGGVFTSAYLIGICRLPVHTTAAATLLATFCGSLAGTLGFAIVSAMGPGGGPAVGPLWTLGLAMGAAGWLGGRTGARLQRRLPSSIIARGLAVLLVALGVAYVARVL